MVNPVQKYTDLTYGALLLVGLLAVEFLHNDSLFVGLGIGIFIGYIVHVGSEMVEFSRMEESVEETREAVEETRESAEKARESAQKVEERVESVEERAEETKEAVEKVDEKTTRVEGAVNANQE